MNEPLDFETVRWKLADDMTPDEAAFIVENKDKLNDEEKAAFNDILLQASPLPDPVLEDEIKKSEEDPENTDPKNQIPEQELKDKTPTAPVVPDNVVTQEKLDTYLETKRKEWEAEGKTKAEQIVEEKKIFDVFEKGADGKEILPGGWNEAVNKFAPAIIEEAEKRVLAKLEKQNKEIAENQEKFRQSSQQLYNRFEEEFSTLSKNKLIPDPKEHPEEYKKAHAAIIKIGDENGKTNVTDAYKLWSIIPEDHGGGLKIGNTQLAEKAKIDAQKAAASKIGSGRGTAAAPKNKSASYEYIHGARLDDLVDARLAQPN